MDIDYEPDSYFQWECALCRAQNVSYGLTDDEHGYACEYCGHEYNPRDYQDERYYDDPIYWEWDGRQPPDDTDYIPF